MRVSTSLASVVVGFASLVSASTTATTTTTPSTVQGLDFLEFNVLVNWSGAKNNGVEFVYIKATEGLGYVNPLFEPQTTSAMTDGLLHGAIHFANCDESSGATQAEYFLAHGGDWHPDGHTLPGALELEGNVPGVLCFGMSAAQITAWIREFVDTYKTHTGRFPVIFLSAQWWAQCAGNDGSFGTELPLWVANWGKVMGALPAGWTEARFWQYSGNGPDGGEQDVFLGDQAALTRFVLHS